MKDDSRIKRIYHIVYYGGVIPLYEKIRNVDFYENIAPSVTEHNQYMMTTLRMRIRLKRYFNRLHISQEDHIIDVGCGKGRMLHFFSKYKFGLIDGIEFDEDTAAIAKANIDSLYGKKKKRKRIHIMVADATNFDQYDRYNYVYFFNSFKGNLLRAFLRMLKSSIVDHPRQLLLVYSHAHFGKEIVLDEGFTIVDDFPNEDIIVYTYAGKEG